MLSFTKADPLLLRQVVNGKFLFSGDFVASVVRRRSWEGHLGQCRLSWQALRSSSTSSLSW